MAPSRITRVMNRPTAITPDLIPITQSPPAGPARNPLDAVADARRFRARRAAARRVWSRYDCRAMIGRAAVSGEASKGSCPQVVGNRRTHLPHRRSRAFRGRVHRRIPRTAGLSTVRTAHRPPPFSSWPRSRVRPQNPQPVDNSRAQPGYDRADPRPHSSPARPQPACSVVHVVEKPLTSGRTPSAPTFSTPRSHPVGEFSPQPHRTGGQSCPQQSPTASPTSPPTRGDTRVNVLPAPHRPPARRSHAGRSTSSGPTPGPSPARVRSARVSGR